MWNTLEVHGGAYRHRLFAMMAPKDRTNGPFCQKRQCPVLSGSRFWQEHPICPGTADEKDAQWDRQALVNLSITAMTPMNSRRAFASYHLTPEPHIGRSKAQPFRVLSGNKQREESRLSARTHHKTGGLHIGSTVIISQEITVDPYDEIRPPTFGRTP